MFKFQLLIFLSIVTSLAIKAADTSDMNQQALAEFADEISSSTIRESPSYKPHTGNPELNKILLLLHKSYMATNQGDTSKAKIYTIQAKELIDKWKARVQSESTDKSGNH